MQREIKRPGRLTDLRLRSLLKERRAQVVPDGTVSGLAIRFFGGGSANWSLHLRVVGEGGVNKHGKHLVGKKIRISLGHYATNIEEAEEGVASVAVAITDRHGATRAAASVAVPLVRFTSVAIPRRSVTTSAAWRG